MNKNDFKNPLIQSGAVLLFVFLLISIVAGSGSHGIGGSISALFSGLISTIIFVIALTLAIIVSILIIILLFIAAVSIYSVDKGRDLFEQFKLAITSLYTKISGSTRRMPGKAAPQAQEATTIVAPVAAAPVAAAPMVDQSAEIVSLKEHLQQVESQYEELHRAFAAHTDQITELQKRFTQLPDGIQITDKINALAEEQQAIRSQVADVSDKLEARSEQLEDFQKTISGQQKTFREELAELHEKTSVPEVVAGILSYIDLPEDRTLITEKATEAISRGMTYSQIDEFFKTSLDPEIYEELSAHPRLTKDFLRSVKKKF